MSEFPQIILPKRMRGKRADKCLAELADRHRLYQLAVQCVEAEIDLVDKTYAEIRGRRAAILREDFCGTANTSCEWVRRRRANTAIGCDVDHAVLDWGRQHNLAELPPAQRARVQLVQHDVTRRASKIPTADLILAMNFSYFTFKTRAALRGYFRAARQGLATDGVLMLDCYGGSESWCNVSEETEHQDEQFTYVWEQRDFNPINSQINCDIHFKFADGSRIQRAFTYAWRMWSIAEIRELLDEAGFTKSTVYWEGTDAKTGEGNDIYSPSERGDDDPSWVVYIAAEK